VSWTRPLSFPFRRVSDLPSSLCLPSAGPSSTTPTTSRVSTSSKESSVSSPSSTKSLVFPQEPTLRSSPSFTSSSTRLNTRPSSRSPGSEETLSPSLTTPSTSNTRWMDSSTRTEIPSPTSSSHSFRTRRTSSFEPLSKQHSLLLLLQPQQPLPPPVETHQVSPLPPLPSVLPLPLRRLLTLPWDRNGRASSPLPSLGRQPSRTSWLLSKVLPSDGNQEEGSPRSDRSSRTRSSRSWTRSVTPTSTTFGASSRTRGRLLGSGTLLRC